MRIMLFKTNYKFPLKNGETIVINPVERILSGHKTSTFRLNPKQIGKYQIRQGSIYKKANIRKDIYLNIYKRSEKSILELTGREIQKDIGFNEQEFELIVENYNGQIIEFFMQGIKTINKSFIKKNKLNLDEHPIGFLHDFKFKKYPKFDKWTY